MKITDLNPEQELRMTAKELKKIIMDYNPKIPDSWIVKDEKLEYDVSCLKCSWTGKDCDLISDQYANMYCPKCNCIHIDE